MFQIWGGGNAMQIGKEGKALKKKKKKVLFGQRLQQEGEC